MKPEKLHSGRGEIEWVSKKWHEQQIAEKDKEIMNLKEISSSRQGLLFQKDAEIEQLKKENKELKEYHAQLGITEVKEKGRTA